MIQYRYILLSAFCLLLYGSRKYYRYKKLMVFDLFFMYNGYVSIGKGTVTRYAVQR